MEEVVRVSLHNHFGGDKADRTLNDSYQTPRSFDMSEAIERINDANTHNYRLIASTNSNIFHAAQYSLMRHYASAKNITLLPGTEINLKNWDQDKYLHIVLLFDPAADLLNISSLIDDAIFENKGCFLTLSQMIQILLIGRCIMAIHGLKQEDDERSASKNGEMLPDLADLNCFYPVIIEDSQSYHKETLLARVKHYLSEDQFEWLESTASISAADRKSFSEIKSPTVLWGNPSFDDLYYATLMGCNRLFRERDLVSKVSYISKIEIKSSSANHLESSTINCSHGTNAIIGSSGGGKTLLLDVIKRKITGDALLNKSIDSDYAEIYDVSDIVLYDKNGQIIDETSPYEVIEGENLYQRIIQAYRDDKETLLEELGIRVDFKKWRKYIDVFNDNLNAYLENMRLYQANSKHINACLNRIKGAAAFIRANPVKRGNFIDYMVEADNETRKVQCEARISDFEKDIQRVENSFKDVLRVIAKNQLGNDLNAKTKDLQAEITAQLKKLMNTTKSEALSREKQSLVQSKIYNEVQKYNSVTGEQAKQVVEKRQELTNSFAELANLLFENVKIERRRALSALSEQKLRNSLGFKGNEFSKLIIKSINTTVSYDELLNAFSSNIGTGAKVRKTCFSKTGYDFSSLEQVKQFLQVFLEENYKDSVVFSLPYSSVIDYGIELFDAAKGIYRDMSTVNAGTLGQIYVNHFLDREVANAGNNIVLVYDQPENNMEKEFIHTQLANKLTELRKQHQIFLATHEPLLVINADSNNIVRAKNEKTIGARNAIQYENISFVGKGGKAELINEIAKLIDGDTKAVNQRDKVYRGMKNEN